MVVDTEEEFDWSKPFSRESVSVTAIEEIGRLQRLVAPYGLKPTYVIDFPVATTPSSIGRLQEFVGRNECVIGAHLHPWVNPPFQELLSRRTSYACNLGSELEREKIRLLKDAISEHLAVGVRAYKAGRYGFGPTTADTLETLGFDVDLSVNPHMDYTDDGGPSFSSLEPVPMFFGRDRTLLEIPCTTGFTGIGRNVGQRLHALASASWLAPLRAVGVLARTGTLNKVMLSPEMSTVGEMQALTKTLCRDGIRTFALTLHSPSLKPGCTPYVATAQQRDAFMDTIARYLDFFFGSLAGLPSTPSDLYDALCKGRPS